MSIDTGVGLMALSILSEESGQYIRAHTTEREGRRVYVGEPSYINKYIQLEQVLRRN